MSCPFDAHAAEIDIPGGPMALSLKLGAIGIEGAEVTDLGNELRRYAGAFRAIPPSRGAGLYRLVA